MSKYGVKPRGRVEGNVAIPPISNDPMRAIIHRTRLQMSWLVTHYAKQIRIGDGVLIWHTGAQAGIYGTAEVIEQPKMWDKQPDIDYWLDKRRLGSKPQAIVRFPKKLLDRPLLRETLKQHPLLKSLSVIRQPNATNYKVTTKE